MSNVKVTTELDDKASPGLKKLRDSIDGIGKGSNGLSSSLKDLAGQFGQLGQSGVGSMEGLAKAGGSLASQMTTIGAVVTSGILGIKGYAAAAKSAAQAEEVFAAAIKRRNEANAASKAFTAAFGRVNNRSNDAGMQGMAAEKARLNAVAREANGLLKNLGLEKNIAASELALSSFVRTAVVGLGSVAAVAGTVYLGIEAMAVSLRAAADDTAELADKMGLTVGQLEALTIVAKENGTTVEGLQKVFDKLSKSMNKADEDNAKALYAFESLGIQMSDLAGLSEKEVAGIIIKNYEILGRSTQATAAVMQLLGPSFRDQIPAIKEMASGVASAEERIKKFGAETTPELIKAGGEQEIAFTNLGLAWKGFSIQVSTLAGTIVKDAAEMVSGLLNWVRKGLQELNQYKAQAAEIKDNISPERRREISDQVKDEQKRGFVPKTNEAFIKRRLELYNEELSVKRKIAEEDKSDAAREAARFKRQSEAPIIARAAAAKPPGKASAEAKELKSSLEEMVAQLNIANRAFGMDDSVKQGLEARKKYVEDIKKGIDPKVAAALLKEADAAIALGAALKKAAEEQKAFEEAKQGLEDYKAETDYIAYEATLIGKTADERERLLTKFREEVQLRKTIAGLGETDVANITAQTRAAMEARDAAKKSLEDSRITNEVLSQSYGFVQEDVTRRIQSAKALLEAGKITVDDYVKYVNSQTDRLKDNTKQNLDEMQAFYAEAAKGIQQDFQSFFFDIMEGNMTSLGKSVQKTINSIIAQMLAAKAATALFGSDYSKGTLGGYAGTAVNFLGGLFGGARAAGGPVQAGRAYLVGERGPEPFIPSQSGTILPTQSLGSSGPSVTVNLTAIDTKDFMGKMNEVKRELAGLVNNTNRSYRLQGAY